MSSSLLLGEKDKSSPQNRTAGPAGRPERQRRPRLHPALLAFPFVLISILALWEGLVRWQDYPPFILPRPADVARRALSLAADGSLWRHTQVTLLEIGLGLLLGVSLALVLGYLLGRSHALDRLLSPYIVASQTIPVVAVAPLLVIWFGSGLLSKVLVTALIVFFPTLVSTVVGIRNVDPDLHDLMRSLRATRRQIFTKLELPAALPVLFGGFKLSVILAVVGAVVGEFVGADAGLGFLINLGRGVLDTSMIFVAVFTLVLIAQALYLTVTLLENRLLRWQRV
ncbi:MAG: ABC transporter permease [Caldilineae bacterium]|nr:MAG: ABC transporter permease [Caldilineae bacterium]